VSAVSFLEIAIQHARAQAAEPMLLNAADARDAFTATGFVELPLTAAADALDALLPLHRDPFDRMLLAQARTEPLRLLTADCRLTAYGPDVVLV